MTLDTLLALAVFAFVSSATPGPNNFMLMASGVNFGFRRTLPHMFGIAAGFALLLIAVGLGLGVLLTAYPQFHLALKLVGGIYLLHLAWKIATSRSIADAKAAARPMTFLEAAAFQCVNPKAWVLAVSATSVYTNPQAPVLSIIAVVLAFSAVSVPIVSIWTGFGMVLRQFLAHPVRLKWFNIVMGTTLALTLWPMLR